MFGRTAQLVSLASIAVCGGVGALQAVSDDETAFALLFCLITIIALAGFAAAWRSPAAPRLRDDVASWLEATSAITGESSEALANRAVSAYRASLSDDGGE